MEISVLDVDSRSSTGRDLHTNTPRTGHDETFSHVVNE